MSFFTSAKIQNASTLEARHVNDSVPIVQQEDAPRLVSTQDGTVIYASTALSTLCATENLIGQNLGNIFIFNNHHGEIIDGEYDVTIQESQRELRLEFQWITDQNGQEFLIASAEAITAGHKLLQYVANKVSEQHQEQASPTSDTTPFIEMSFDACCITDQDGKFITINKNFTNIFGHDIESLTEKTLIDLIHPDHKDTFGNGLHALQHEEAEPFISLDSYCIGNEGKPLWIEWNHKKVGDQIYSTGRDLTPLKAYKDSLKRQEKKLIEAEAIGHIGQWEWPVGSENIQFSNQLYDIFGIEKTTFKPTLDNINGMIHRSDSGRMMQVFQRAIIEQNDYDMDFRINRPDGNIRYIRCEGRCEINEEDDVIALYGIMQDVTEATIKEQDILKAKDSVERAYAAKTQFLANMSHELRTPLNAIIGFSEMIERQLLGPIGTEKYLEYISGIRESGEHLLDLISDILDMSKIEAGKYELNVEKFNVAKVIRMAAHMMEGRAIDSEIKIKINITNEELNIIADRRAVMQMVLNLLSNSVKFSHHGGIVDIILEEQPEHISILISDKGIGIPANKLANITMPFEQAESHYTREYEGSGLGLSITKELAEIHGGNIDVKSTLDVGTDVTIHLPYEAQK